MGLMVRVASKFRECDTQIFPLELKIGYIYIYIYIYIYYSVINTE
jgi:hypothetical protein